MKEKKYISRAISEASNKVVELDDDYDASTRMARLIYEDDRRSLIEKRNKLVKKREKHSLLFVISLIALFAALFFFGISTSNAASCEWIEDHVLNTGQCLTPAKDQSVRGNPEIATAVFAAKNKMVEAGFSTIDIRKMFTGYISDVCPRRLAGLRDHNWDAMVICSNNYDWWFFLSPARVIAHEALHHFYKGEAEVIKHVNLLFQDAKLYKETYND